MPVLPVIQMRHKLTFQEKEKEIKNIKSNSVFTWLHYP